jgi:hypothetical protein
LAEGEFIPLLGEVCYAVDNDILYQKIGDGVTDFTKLPWLNNITPQPDHDENDETSLSYIKNRLAYTKIEEILPENQEIGYYEYPNDRKVNIGIYNFEEDAGLDPEVIGFPADATDYVQCESSQSYFFNNVNILNEIFDSKNEFIVVLKDKNSKYEFLLDPLNVSTFEESGMVINTFLVGNPIAANLVLQEMLDIPGSFSEDKNTNLDYVLLLITVENDPDYPNEIMSQVIFIGNTKSFLLEDEESCTISINHTKQEVVHKIDEKYLPEIEQSDLNEIDSSKPSYIRNKIGDLMVVKMKEDYDYRNDYFSASIELGTYNSEECSAKLGAITIDHPFPTSLIAPKYLSYDITLNGVTYFQCPITYCSQVLGRGSTLSVVGNPAYLTVEGVFSQDNFIVEGTSFEDNGLPFLFIIDWNEDDPFGKSFFVTQELYNSLGSTLTIKMV